VSSLSLISAAVSVFISAVIHAPVSALYQYLMDTCFLFRLVGGGVQLGPLGTAATDCPIVIMMMENLVE
jgi:hypothetical protein